MRGLPREKALATVVHLLETTFIRVGNDDYARQNNTYGLTTLKSRHAAIGRNEVRFRFTGKSGKQRSSHVKNRRVAKIIRACQELPGQDLLDLDKAGNSQNVSSSGNSRTICRKYYLHPEGLSSYMDGNLMLEIKSDVDSEFARVARGTETRREEMHEPKSNRSLDRC